MDRPAGYSIRDAGTQTGRVSLTRLATDMLIQDRLWPRASLKRSKDNGR